MCSIFFWRKNKSYRNQAKVVATFLFVRAVFLNLRPEFLSPSDSFYHEDTKFTEFFLLSVPLWLTSLFLRFLRLLRQAHDDVLRELCLSLHHLILNLSGTTSICRTNSTFSFFRTISSSPFAAIAKTVGRV